MTSVQWFNFILILQLIHGLGTWKLYQKAGRKAWEAYVPVYNALRPFQNIKQTMVLDILYFLTSD